MPARTNRQGNENQATTAPNAPDATQRRTMSGFDLISSPVRVHASARATSPAYGFNSDV